MEKRRFYVALGVPRGADADAIRPAYRKVVQRYRRELGGDNLDDPTEPPLAFQVMRTYSERRHAALLDQVEPLACRGESEVDRFYRGYVPEALAPKAARRDGKDLFVELRLEVEEARRGGLFAIHIPVVQRCPACHGGEAQQLVCAQCQGSEQLTVDRLIEITTPPGVSDGQVARLAMEDVGLGQTDLLVLVVVTNNG